MKSENWLTLSDNTDQKWSFASTIKFAKFCLVSVKKRDFLVQDDFLASYNMIHIRIQRQNVYEKLSL